jgi:predicted SAM-dependent methyltransferase
VYLPGYVNIDYPAEDHTVQTQDVADVHADLTRLTYADESVAEVRLHHVLEHFAQATVLRLLVDWYAWLIDGGTLTVETPDFERCCQELVKRRTQYRREVVMRHVFGSHEAPWAVHHDGWYEEKFEHVLTTLGYGDLKFAHVAWEGTFNITVSARKRRPFMDRRRQDEAAETLLHESVDGSAAEQRMLEAWLEQFRGLRIP